jgi:hypothetical protein
MRRDVNIELIERIGIGWNKINKIRAVC